MLNSSWDGLPFGPNRHEPGPKIGGLGPFFGGRVLGHHVTRGLGRGCAFVASGMLIRLAVWPQQTWAKNWGGDCAPWGAGSASNTVARDEAYLHTNWHLDPCSHLAATDMGWKLGVCVCPFGGGELGLHLTQCGQGRGLPACQVSSWSDEPFGLNTPTLQTAQTDRTDRQTDRQWTDSIRRTVLQTVAQKSQKNAITSVVNAFRRKLTRMRLLVTGGFCAQPI